MTGTTNAGLSRRRLLTLAGAGALGAGGAAAWAVGAHDEQPFQPRQVTRPAGQPNFLVVLADDLGWADLSCYGAPSIRTPRLDELAASGLRFTDGYSASSVCSPTRFALYTGRYPGRLRGGLQEPIGTPTPVDGIPASQPTLASQLKKVGYDTAMIGKWHCGFLPWFSPTRVGWDEFIGNFSGGLDYFSKVNHNGDYDLYENEVEYQDLRYYTHVLTERAVDFVTREHSKPWLLNLNFTTPHWPWEGPGDQAVSAELKRRQDAGEPGVLFHADGGSLDVYRSMVEDLDAAVGTVLDALAGSGQRKRTLVLFASDNGGERFSYTWPFTGAKYSLHEGGIRVPMLLSWPGTLPGQRISHEPVITMDWTATLLDLADAAMPAKHPLDGDSLTGYLFDGRPHPGRDLFWRMSDQAALRRGHLKYLRAGKEEHLFDLSADVHEQADLAGDRPEVTARLHDAWDRVNKTLLPYE
jgi:arylsulfatase A-like enzyme